MDSNPARVTPRVERLRRETEMLLDELLRRVNRVRALPGRARRKMQANQGRMSVLAIGAIGVLVSATGLVLLLRARRRRRQRLPRLRAKLRALGQLLMHPERLERPQLSREVAAAVLRGVSGRVATDVASRLLKR